MLAILNSNYVVQKLNADLQLMGQKGSRRLASTIPKEFVFQRFLIQTGIITSTFFTSELGWKQSYP